MLRRVWKRWQKRMATWPTRRRAQVGLWRPTCEPLEDRTVPNGDFGFAWRIGGTAFDEGVGLCTDAAGNLYVSGRFSGVVDFDPGPGTVNLNSASGTLFVAKYSSTGALSWARNVGDDGGVEHFQESLAIDGSGNVYLTGWFIGSPDFDPGPSSYTLSGDLDFSTFVLKLNAQGNFVWAKALKGPGSSEARSGGIALDSDSNVYVAGEFLGTIDFDPESNTYNLTSAGVEWDMFVLKLNTAGSFVWAKSWPSTVPTRLASIALDGADNVLTAGKFQGTVDFDPGPGTYDLTSTNPDGYDIFVTKLDSAGDFAWARTFGRTTTNEPQALTTDLAGNVYTAGSFYDTADFDPGPDTHNLTSAGDQDLFVSKLDAGGNFVWAKARGGMGRDVTLSIVVDGASNVYTTGWFRNTADFDPSPDTYDLTSAGADDTFVTRLDAVGNFVWARSVGGPANDWSLGIALDDTGNVYTTGRFSETTDFDPGPDTYNLTSAGSVDVFILQLTQVCPLAFTIPAGNGPNDLTLRLHGADLEIFDNTTEAVVASQPLAQTSAVHITGASDEGDTLRVDFAFGGFFTVPEGITFDGGAGGPDTLHVFGADASFVLSDSGLIISGPGSLNLTLAGIEQASLTGGGGANTLDASAFTGHVTLDGGAGDDLLLGGKGSAVLAGGTQRQ